MQNDSAYNGIDNLKIATLWENAPLIHNDAIFIADSHFMPTTTNEQSKIASQSLIAYFESLLANSQHIPSQIFLMGDIAHLLLGGVDSSYKSNQKLLVCIESLSKLTQIWWFEGNHDFKLKSFKEKLFQHIKIIERTEQPMVFCFKHKEETKHFLLAHGDLFLNIKYELYIRFMQTRFTRFLMSLCDIVTFGNLYSYIITKVNQKNIRAGKVEMSAFAPTRITAYENFIQKRLQMLNAVYGANTDSHIDVIIEGHFHIGQTYTDTNKRILYVSLPSFYVNGSIFAIKSLFDFLNIHKEDK